MLTTNLSLERQAGRPSYKDLTDTVVQIIDFGCAISQGVDRPQVVGTLHYRAPEVYCYQSGEVAQLRGSTRRSRD